MLDKQAASAAVQAGESLASARHKKSIDEISKATRGRLMNQHL
jgi:hypothetical protein